MADVLISTGEASGDVVGAALIKEMRCLGFAGTFDAVGGVNLHQAGGSIVADSSAWGAVGVVQSVQMLPRALRGFRRTCRHMRESPPKLLIPVDFGFFNVRLARRAKDLGSKVLYFMPPGSWRKTRQGGDLPAVSDAIATPFQWSAALLVEAGANAYWVGHPVMQLAQGLPNSERDLFALFPGSRSFEVANNMRLIADSLQYVDTEEFRPTIVAAANVSDESLFRNWPANRVRPAVWRDGSLKALSRSRAAIICSGTATLEAAVCGVPMVMIYHLRSLQAIQAWYLRKHIRFAALPNILAEREVVPEMVLEREDAQDIGRIASLLLGDSPERAAQLEGFREIRGHLGPPDAITRTAKIALEMLAV